MTMRKTIIANGEYYHIFNRGTDKKTIFATSNEYRRFLDLMRLYQYEKPIRFSFLNKIERENIILERSGEKLVEIICYCLMPNHYHLLLKQNSDNGISRFIRIITNSYARYFNIAHERTGILFQGNFKAVRVEDNEQLLYLSRYIHNNPRAGFLQDNSSTWNWSSIHEFISNSRGQCDKQIILEQFRNTKTYLNFIDDYKNNINTRSHIENLILD